jgi:toxin ParE1/3/4
MPRFTIAPAAQDDIVSILAWTEEHFGERARRRYEALIEQAIVDVAANPDRAGAAVRPEINSRARTYHLVHSRRKISPGIGVVKSPRHFLLFRAVAVDAIEIGRVLHDSMDLNRHLPDEYRAVDDG